MRTKIHRRIAGATLVETIVSLAISAFAIGALALGSITLQKSFRAAEQYSVTQAAQLRVLDYVAMDLRRATGWPPGTSSEIQVSIPNYYDTSDPNNPKPREPKVAGGVVYYGQSSSDALKVRYYTSQHLDGTGRRVNDVHRTVTAGSTTTDTILVSGVQDFELSFNPTDPKKQIVYTKITFPPAFRPFIDSGNIYRDGTATFATTMVRNKR